MTQDKFETKLERFVINHYDGIANTLAAVYLSGMTLILLFGTPPVLGYFTALLIGLAIIPMVLVGAPHRRRMKSWRHEQARRNDEKLKREFIPVVK